MELTSRAFAHNGKIPSRYTCDGENVSPPLAISNVPKEAASLALIVDDPDASAGVWVHWLVWNIDPKTTCIEEDSVPPGASEGSTSFGVVGYGGPCPHRGIHRYVFKLYALDTALNLPPEADKAALENAMQGRVIAEATLIGLYNRS